MTSRTLRRRLAASLIPISVLIVVDLIGVAVAVTRVEAARAHVMHDVFRAYSLSAQLSDAVRDQESTFQSYVLTADREFLNGYRSARSAEARLIRRLAVAERALPGFAQRRRAMQREIEAWRATAVEPRIAAGEGADLPGTSALLVSQRAMADVRASITTYQRALIEQRRRSVAHLDEATRWLFVVMGLGALLLAGAATMLWLAVRRAVIAPLERLGAEVDRVHAGELSHEVNVAEAPREITVLAEQVDRMRLRILEEYASVLHAREAAAEAHRLVEEQAEELQRSNAELEQFAYVASHDLQEPLRKVASFCQLLERRYRDQLDERGMQYIDFAVDGAKRMQQLINDLLAFSRVGRITSGFAPVDLEETLAQALRQLESATEGAGAQITHDPLPTVEGEHSLLVQLFQNLVGNAVKFRRNEPVRIHLGARRVDDHWEFCCADNGIGIEAQYADKIFVIFQRLHGRDAYAGTGIGLAMCKKIVEYHNGRMWLDTDATEGATIRWTLPAATGTAALPTDDGERNGTR